MTTQHDTPDELSDFTQLLRDEREFAVGPQVDPKIRRRRRVRGWVVALVVLAVIVGVPASYVAWALNAPISAPRVSMEAPDVPPAAAAALTLPTEGASAISISGAEAYFGAAPTGISTASGSDDPLPIGSISKLITALVILDAKPLGAEDPGPTLTFSEADNDLYDKYYVMGATIAAMPTGSSMSQRDALATMLIPSASNYAEAVSNWAFGSQGAFVGAARRWLANHGLVGTTMVEPTGISPRNRSTKADLLAIGALAAAHPVIAQIVATTSMSLPGPGPIYNTNDLLGQSGITGLKTGNLGEGSYNLLYTASLDAGAAGPIAVAGVMLGGFSHATVNADVLALLSSIRAGFHDVALSTAGQQIGTYATPWGSSASIVIARAASVYTWSDTPITVALETRTPSSYEDGAVVGTITWTAGPKTASADVVIEGAIEPPTDWWRLTHPDQLGEQ
jgi:D-alanyl-D-alanine carboxypeptidase (penicillin-binding protein 5/6)